jgi:Ni/Fe-hydrogenase 1 B-type cytochrome subunit
VASPDTVTVYNRVYVWQWPVRLYHWVNALCVVSLIATGLLIGAPLAISYSTEAYQQYWFGTVRFIHFVTAFVYFFNFLFRIYWGFVGNRFARWHRFIPYSKRQWKQIMDVLRIDVLLTSSHGQIPIGHNMLAGFVYFLSFMVFLFQAATGFALYSAMSASWLPARFAWFGDLLGGDMVVRQWHHIFTWFFVVFVIVHVYLVFYHDYVEGRGTTSSMVGGWKFARKDVLKDRER